MMQLLSMNKIVTSTVVILKVLVHRVFTDIPNLDIFYSEISKKLPLLITSPISSERPLCIENLSSVGLETQILSLATNADSCFSPSVRITWFVFRKMSTKVWIIIVFLSDVISIKYGVQCETQLIQPAAQPHKEYLPCPICGKNAVWVCSKASCEHRGNSSSVLPFSLQMVLKSQNSPTQHTVGKGLWKLRASLW